MLCAVWIFVVFFKKHDVIFLIYVYCIFDYLRLVNVVCIFDFLAITKDTGDFS